jgi:hypothetical protein
MKWNDHSRLEGSHAFLGASQYHWLNYDEQKLIERWKSAEAIKRGTELHELAAKLIAAGVKLPSTGKAANKTLNAYVNDAIGFHMQPEQVLYYSDNCFGTADSIVFNDDFLRIHDLKTGVSPASMNQLFIYDALFCMEYDIRPGDIQIENRIYQNDEILIAEPTAEQIAPIISKIKTFDKIMNSMG